MQATIKKDAIELINSLPDSTTWDDIMYEIYVKQKIDKGLDEVKNGKLTRHEIDYLAAFKTSYNQ